MWFTFLPSLFSFPSFSHLHSSHIVGCCVVLHSFFGSIALSFFLLLCVLYFSNVLFLLQPLVGSIFL
jgi:hypothetical protein